MRDDEVLQWIDANGLVNSIGKNFEWFKHAFLIEPLCDMHPRQGVNKSAQVGWSETMIIKAMYLALRKNLNIIYTLPTEEFISKFVPPKVDPIIENNGVLNGNVKGGVHLKIVGSGLTRRNIYFMGAFNPKSVTNKEESSKGVSVTADLLIHDEASRSDQFILQQMRSRTENSDYDWRWLFDNPDTPGKGADSIYRVSDQKHWIITCSRCKHKQYMEWARLDKVEFKKGSMHTYVDTEKKEFICGKCAKPIHDKDRVLGEWVAKYPSKSEAYRGYWLSQMCYVQHSVEKILVKDDDPTFPRSQFHNFVLGKPYIGSDIKVSKENIMNNHSGDVNRLVNNVMGIDQGKVKWYVIGNDQGIVATGRTESWDEIEMLFNRYQCTAVADALPFQNDPKRLAKKYPGRFFRAFYKNESDQAELAKFGTKNDNSVVLIRREEMFDELAGKINKSEYPIQAPMGELQDYIKHWENLVRIVEQDSNGNDRFKWERTGDDHLAHANLYMEVAKFKAVVQTTTVMKPEDKMEVVKSFKSGDKIANKSLFDEFS